MNGNGKLLRQSEREQPKFISIHNIVTLSVCDRFFICWIESPQCTAKYSKKIYSIAIFLP